MTTRTTTTLTTALAEVAERVEAAMHADLYQRLAGSDPLLQEVLDYALFAGGKRIRPFLCVLASRCCDRDDTALYTLAAALEYLHTATLMHDDVIDHAPLRRGRKSVMERFSPADAILAGDWLHARSLYLVGRLTGTPGLDTFCATTESMVNGEFLQKRLCDDQCTDENAYEVVIRQKTGNLIASSCVLGALYAGADPAQVLALQRYGEAIGMAFQIVDDLLDYTGKGEKTGKEAGNDFREGKLTLPLLRALAHADADERSRMEALMQGDRTGPGVLESVCAFIRRWHGFQSAADTAQAHVEAALQALAPLAERPQAARHAALLRELATFILVRHG